MESDVKPVERTEPTASSLTPPERAFADLARRLMARSSSAGRGLASAAAPLAAGGAWANLSAKANATPAIPQTITFDPVLVRLVNRLSGSFDIEQYADAVNLGFAGYLSQQLAPQAITDTNYNNFITGSDPIMQATVDTTKSAFDLFVLQGAGSYLLRWQELVLGRQIVTKRRLLERMVDFWSDHFSVDLYREGVLLPKMVEDRDAFRTNALGTFSNLLTASALGTPMSIYLDNGSNSYQAGQPNDGYNENFAREFFELHTLGASSAYTEADIRTAAAAWAGHTWNPTFGPALGTPLWVPQYHNPNNPAATILVGTGTPVSILAPNPATGGQNQALDLIAGCHSHPDTRRYVSGKLLRWLLRYDIDNPAVASLRTGLQSSWASTQGNIAALVQLILTPANLALGSGGLYARKFKRPQQFATGLARAMEASVLGITATSIGHTRLRDDLERLGHAPFSWGPPNGYPDSEAAWLGGLLSRWELADKLLRSDGNTANSQLYDPSITIPDSKLLTLFAGVPFPLFADRISDLLTGGTMTTFEKTQIQNYLNQLPAGPVSEIFLWIREGIALGACTPTYQYY